ncbi:MAG: GNAT family protein [Bacteroidota bacterium]
MHPNHWGSGYATEAVQAILAFGFEQLQLHRIEAGVATANIASIKVLERVGMLREGLCRKILPIRGEWYDNYMYAMLEEDYYQDK